MDLSYLWLLPVVVYLMSGFMVCFVFKEKWFLVLVFMSISYLAGIGASELDHKINKAQASTEQSKLSASVEESDYYKCLDRAKTTCYNNYVK